MSELVKVACISFVDGTVYWLEFDAEEIERVIQEWGKRNTDFMPFIRSGVYFSVGVMEMPAINLLHAKAMNFDQLDDIDEDPDVKGLHIVEDDERDTIEIEGIEYQRSLFRKGGSVYNQYHCGD